MPRLVGHPRPRQRRQVLLRGDHRGGRGFLPARSRRVRLRPGPDLGNAPTPAGDDRAFTPPCANCGAARAHFSSVHGVAAGSARAGDDVRSRHCRSCANLQFRPSQDRPVPDAGGSWFLIKSWGSHGRWVGHLATGLGPWTPRNGDESGCRPEGQTSSSRRNSRAVLATMPTAALVQRAIAACPASNDWTRTDSSATASPSQDSRLHRGRHGVPRKRARSSRE